MNEWNISTDLQTYFDSLSFNNSHIEWGFEMILLKSTPIKHSHLLRVSWKMYLETRSAHMLWSYSVSAEWASKSQRGTWKLWSTGWWGRPDLCLFTHAAVCFSVAAQKQHRRKSQLHMNILDKNLQHGGEIWWQFSNSCVLNRVPLFPWAKILKKHVTLPEPNASSPPSSVGLFVSQTCCYTPSLLAKDSQPACHWKFFTAWQLLGKD